MSRFEAEPEAAVMDMTRFIAETASADGLIAADWFSAALRFTRAELAVNLGL